MALIIRFKPEEKILMKKLLEHYGEKSAANSLIKESLMKAASFVVNDYQKLIYDNRDLSMKVVMYRNMIENIIGRLNDMESIIEKSNEVMTSKKL